jgi:CHAD domain-containing protein
MIDPDPLELPVPAMPPVAGDPVAGEPAAGDPEAQAPAAAESPATEPAPPPAPFTGSAVELALGVLREQFGRMLAHDPGTRLGQDPEELHDMRVAVRRMRAALKIFREVLPPRVVRLSGPLSWIGGVLGPVRDLDVQQSRLDLWCATVDPGEREALEALSSLLARRHAAARRRMLRALDTARYRRLVERISRELAREPGRKGARRRPAALEAPPIVRRRYRSAHKQGRRVEPDGPPEPYHRLRIRCKALRYALEFHAALWGDPARRMIRAVVALQDLLGEHQDAVVAAADLRALALRAGLPRPTVFVVGRIAERYDQRMRELRRRLPDLLDAARGSRWRRLRREMERQALAATRRSTSALGAG